MPAAPASTSGARKPCCGSYDERARELLDDVGLTGDAETVVVNLPYGLKRALEIATTLALDPEMMLLDEPTAGMAHGDVDRIVAADPPHPRRAARS